jgi:hypothetical protein
MRLINKEMEEHFGYSTSPITGGLEQVGKHSSEGVVQDYSVAAHTPTGDTHLKEVDRNVNIDRAQLQALGAAVRVKSQYYVNTLSCEVVGYREAIESEVPHLIANQQKIQ